MTAPLHSLPIGKWVPIAKKDLTAHTPRWSPITDCPLTIGQAHLLVDDGLITMAHRYGARRASLEVFRWREPKEPRRYFTLHTETFRPSPQGNAAQAVLGVLNDRPAEIGDVARRAGVHFDTARSALKALAAQGLVIREYGERGRTFWSLPAKAAE